MSAVSIERTEIRAETETEAKAKAADLERAGILSDCVKQWNNFVKGLIATRVSWEKYRDVRLDNAVQLEEFPLEVQKMFYLANPHGDFDLLVEDIVTQPNIKEHLKTLLIPIK